MLLLPPLVTKQKRGTMPALCQLCSRASSTFRQQAASIKLQTPAVGRTRVTRHIVERLQVMRVAVLSHVPLHVIAPLLPMPAVVLNHMTRRVMYWALLMWQTAAHNSNKPPACTAAVATAPTLKMQ